MRNLEKTEYELDYLKQQQEVNQELIKVSQSLVATLKQYEEEPNNTEVLAVIADLEGQQEQLKAKTEKISKELAHL
ncbi:hypothetical protein SFC34_24350 [Priestia aryabhattai]|uniref:Uncharacterized protein n=3 Tax=Priestia TaxID=2800373 RepID=A0A2T7JDM0_PRIMG|nr:MULTISPECIES: hypothetical protein [Priestia]MBU8854886.1 hypothetical protein [Bacillus sp. FJAT-26377]CJG04691.1 Uncharacterised protein [Streptococcus pneumoniae]AEN91637.1 hypothetical protein BMWSH_4759 [Priestia megaterium WSH-002]AXI32529.1 hypothetical protein CIB87_27440 [Priestia megaterium]MBU3571301.1 hypothetical protein [Priestia aryabhattai]